MANRHTPDNRRGRILQYLCDNPGSTPDNVAAGMKMDRRLIVSELCQLERTGCATRDRVEGTRICFWHATGRALGMGGRIDVARRVVVSKWKPHLVRDPLVAALYGPAEEAA